MVEYATPVKIDPPIEVSLDRFVEILKQESQTMTGF
jgi:hypothetical protein